MEPKGVEIIEVTTPAQLREFIRFPDRLYKGCPYYVPALHSDQKHSLTKCASLQYCPHVLYLAKDAEGRTVGRISAFVNPRYNERYSKKCCRFGWFDVVEDFDVAKALIDKASEWAKAQGMNRIHGPLFYNTLGKQGMVVEGFDHLPQFNNLYNYPYYPVFMERLGFVKECDWIQYRMFGAHLPERLGRIAEALMARYKLHRADVNALKKNHEMGMEFIRNYSEIFSREVYNFIPFTEAEMEEELRQSVSMIDNRYCSIFFDENESLAVFDLNCPSVSRAMQKARGRMLPFGWIHFLKAMLFGGDTVDMVLTGATDKWNGKGLSALLHYDICTRFGDSKKVKYFISNPQLENNKAVQVWDSYPDKELYVRRRCYIKDL